MVLVTAGQNQTAVEEIMELETHKAAEPQLFTKPCGLKYHGYKCNSTIPNTFPVFLFLFPFFQSKALKNAAN